MRPETLARHFARIKTPVWKYYIDTTRLFNFDKSGLSRHGITFGRAKWIVPKSASGNTRELNITGSVDHVIVMSVVSAAGQFLSSLVVWPGVDAQYRKWNGKFQTPTDLLPKPGYVFMQRPAGVDTWPFERWATNFVKETTLLRRNCKRILLVMVGYSCHLSYNTLFLFKKDTKQQQHRDRWTTSA